MPQHAGFCVVSSAAGSARLERCGCSMTANERWNKAAYFFLLVLQVFGALVFILLELPEFRQIVLTPGEQLPNDNRSDLVIVGIFAGMQIAFWYRLLHVPIPTLRPSPLLCHVFFFWDVSVLFLEALYFRSSFSGIFQNWARRPTYFWQSGAE